MRTNKPKCKKGQRKINLQKTNKQTYKKRENNETIKLTRTYKQKNIHSNLLINTETLKQAIVHKNI